jgi:LPS-assembly lipoprotein
MPLRLKTLFLLGLCLSLMACGFHLRGQGPSSQLIFKTVQVSGAGTAAQELRKALVLQTGVQLVDKNGEAQINIIREGSDKQILSVNSAGQVVQYRVFYRVHFNATANGETLLEDTTISLMRTLQWDENVLLANENEEGKLITEMQRDSSQQIIRRVNSAARQQAAASMPATAP